MRRAFFSPIGTADPMTVLGDGPMLHVVRWCKPDKIVLFLSPKMAGYHKADNRYVRAIEDCCKLTGDRVPEVRIIMSLHDEVHRFDYYIKEFEEALADIQDAEDEAEILANVTSGTPGMQQALVSLGAFGRFNVKLLQVATPRKDANRQGDREDPDNYEYDRLWESNPDNQSDCECRVIEVDTPNFSEQLLRKEILALVKKYDYTAAVELSKDSTGMSQETKDLIRATASRLNLSKTWPTKVFGAGTRFKGTSIEYKNDKQLSEYLSSLEVRFLQGHYADFVRALTPALTETMLHLLDEVLPRETYLSDRSLKTRFYSFDAKKVEANPELLEYLETNCRVNFEKFEYPFLTNDTLSKLLEKYHVEQTDSLKKVNMLREFEYGIRNLLAHQITKMDKNYIEDKGNKEKAKKKDGEKKAERITLEKVTKYLFELNDVEPGLYDRINEVIAEELQ